MKKTLLLSFLAAMFVLLGNQRASAQVTMINGYFSDSSTTYCNTPAPVSGFGYWTIAGSIQPNDSLTFYINYGDGNDTTYKVATTIQGTYQVNHTYLTTGNYQIQIIITNTNSVADTLTGQIYTITNTCSALEGLVWMDNNADCIYNTGEQYMTGYAMKVTNTTSSAVVYGAIDGNGEYHIEVPDGYTYTIEIAYLPGGLTVVCPGTGIVTQAVSGMGTYTHNFGYDCSTTANTDFEVYGWSNFFRPGHIRNLSVSANTDNFCMAYPATVTLNLHPLLTCVGLYSGDMYTTNTGSTVTWNLTSLSQLNTLFSTLQIYCDSFATLGDTLCNLLYVSYTGVTDTNTSNDTFNICKIVSNSYDPNDKQVLPQNGPLGLIENGEELFYLINFQNTGNDTAYDVVVVDTLSNDLNVNTFHLVDASHPVSVTWLPGNVINFRFEDIYLPDSTTNEALSHGHVAFKINAKTGLADGTQITNKVDIYFDFNPPITTNNTLNTIDIPTSVYNLTNGEISAKVYPNPANNELTIATDGFNKFSAQVYDIIGRPVASSVTNTGKVVINTSGIANGMYILHINADGKEMSTKINVQH